VKEEKTADLVKWVHVDLLERLDRQEHRALLDLLVKTEPQEQMEYPETKGLKENEDQLARRDTQVSLVLLADLVFLVSRDSRVAVDQWDYLDQTAKTAKGGRMVNQEVPAPLVCLDERVKMDLQDVQELAENAAKRELVAQLDHQELLDSLVQWDQLDRVENWVLKDFLERREQKEKLETLVRREMWEAWEIKGKQVPRERLEHRATGVTEDLPEHLDDQESRDLLVQWDRLESLDSQEYLVLRVLSEHQEKVVFPDCLECRARQEEMAYLEMRVMTVDREILDHPVPLALKETLVARVRQALPVVLELLAQSGNRVPKEP